MPPLPPPAHETYAKALVPKNHGYPLWEPDPGSNAAVELADVGYLWEGVFMKLFNASKGGDDPSNRFGLPEGHVPFTVGEVLRRTPLPKEEHISSEGVCDLGASVELTGG